VVKLQRAQCSWYVDSGCGVVSRDGGVDSGGEDMRGGGAEELEELEELVGEDATQTR
jgi:hypothetical protein